MSAPTPEPATFTADQGELHFLRVSVWREYERQRSAELFMAAEGYTPDQVAHAHGEANALQALVDRLDVLWQEMHSPRYARWSNG